VINKSLFSEVKDNPPDLSKKSVTRWTD